MEKKEIGPLLTDEKFFGELIDCTLPGLEKIPASASAGDFAACRRLFAAYVRAALKPELFFRLPYKSGENRFMRAGETESEAAERIAGLSLISVGVEHQFEGSVDWFANPTYNQYMEWPWQLSRHHEWKLLAHQYRLTGNEQYARVFAQLFESWVKQAAVPEEDVSGYDTVCWRTIECGCRMAGSWPYALFSFYQSPYFTDDLLVDWYKSVWEHGNRLQKKCNKGNWLVIEMNGLGHIGMLYPQFKKAREWFDFAVDKFIKEMDRQIYPDGFQIELASGYHCVVINGYMAFWRAAQALEVKLPDTFLKGLENMLELLVKLMRPDACLPDINDGSLMWVPGYLQENSEFCTGNRILQWAANGCTGKEHPDYTSVILAYAGMAIMRDGWSENDTWGFLDAGPFGSGHQHEDKLNFLLHANGKYILTECGNYDYDDSQMRRYALSTRSHNTVRVNGQDQNRHRNYRWHDEDICKKASLEYRLEEFFDYVAGVYDEGYGEQTKEAENREGAADKADLCVVHRRSVLFLKNPGPGSIPAFSEKMHSFFIVIDRMEAAEEKEYEFLWHVDADTVAMQGMHVKADFLHIFNNLDDVKKDGLSLVRCQRTPCWQGWKRGKTFVQGNDDALPTVRYTTYDASVRVVTVLYPEEDCCIAAVKAGRSVDDTKMTLVLKDGTCVELDENVYRP